MKSPQKAHKQEARGHLCTVRGLEKDSLRRGEKGSI